ncbi:polysaccharide lyase [Halomonas sp. V046]|uniref:polysaccharide lyase n=1 Tax=Halomonas sp. V046 TaxID=3459611 RepID=UPI0040442231
MRNPGSLAKRTSCPRDTRSASRPRLSPAWIAVLAGLPLAAQAVSAQAASDKDSHLGVPSVAACSERYPLVASPTPALGLQSADEAIREGFSTTRTWGTEDNVELLGGGASRSTALRVGYPEGTSSPGDTEVGGAGFYSAPEGFSGRDHACLRYAVRFEDGFDFVKGGKLPGLYGGEAPSGGDKVTGENGFSLRYMWRENGQGELYEYVADSRESDDDSDYGDSVGRGLFSFPTGQWVTLEQEVILNDPGQENGVVRVWVDGRPVLEQQGMVYRTSDDVTIDGLMFSTFFGGHGKDWRTPHDQHADFADFRFYAPSS